MEYKIFDALPQEAMDIRIEVFVKEQGFRDEFDETDKIAKHIVFYDNGVPIATGRFFTESENEYHIGRLAVVKEYRGKGIGRDMMLAIEEAVRSYGADAVALSAQVRASGFYKKCGYKKVGEEYLDEYCPHIKMVKGL